MLDTGTDAFMEAYFTRILRACLVTLELKTSTAGHKTDFHLFCFGFSQLTIFIKSKQAVRCDRGTVDSIRNIKRYLVKDLA